MQSTTVIKTFSVSSLKQDLDNKLNELFVLNEKPALFLSNYFYSIRNEIDIEAEEKLVAIEQQRLTNKKTPVVNISKELVNQIREWMISELNENEKKLQQAIKNNNNESISSYGELKKNVDSINHKIDSKEMTISDYTIEYEKLILEIEAELDRLKAQALQNKTFFFKKLNQNNFGILAVFEQNYLNEHQVLFLK